MGRVLVVLPEGAVRDAVVCSLHAAHVTTDAVRTSPAGAAELTRLDGYAAYVVDLDDHGWTPHAVGELAAAVDPAPVLVVLDPTDDRRFVAALAAGARGAILSDRPQDAARAVELALTGEAVVPRRKLEVLLASLRTRTAMETASGPVGRLSTRERLVLTLLAEGRSTRQIADQLVVEPVTVRTHVAHIVHKLHVSDREAAVALVQEGSGPATQPTRA